MTLSFSAAWRKEIVKGENPFARLLPLGVPRIIGSLKSEEFDQFVKQFSTPPPVVDYTPAHFRAVIRNLDGDAFLHKLDTST